MDVSSIAAAFISAQAGQVQTAVAAKMLRMNAQDAASVVQLLESAQQNFSSLANVSAGIGSALNITA